MTKNNFTRDCILQGKTSLGIEFGSTRIKAILLNSNLDVIASSSVEWESYINSDGYWTYDENDILKHLQICYLNIKQIIYNEHNITIRKIGFLGISGMMHGYLAFDQNESLLVPFRTWRNTITEEASEHLTNVFKFNIPQRFSISHLYQAMLNQELHVHNISYITTLSGFIHWRLTGEKTLGIGDASGMFPIDGKTNDYNKDMIATFNNISAPYNFNWSIKDILPTVLVSGDKAGALTLDGALLLDPTGELESGIPFCAPEGDAGTGMIATNCIESNSANISVGTSIFAMIVLENTLVNYYKDIDIVLTPNGKNVAMVHTNNGTTELNSWVNLFKEFSKLLGSHISDGDLYKLLLQESQKSDSDLGKLMLYSYHSGEHITNIQSGSPLLVRTAESNFTVSNIMEANLYSSFATLKIGMNSLFANENLSISKVVGHGGVFQTPEIVQRVLATCMEAETSVFETASEGGAWGMAILAMYALHKSTSEIGLEDYLNEFIFKNIDLITITPTKEEIEKFNNYIAKFEHLLPLLHNVKSLMQ